MSREINKDLEDLKEIGIPTLDEWLKTQEDAANLGPERIRQGLKLLERYPRHALQWQMIYRQCCDQLTAWLNCATMAQCKEINVETVQVWYRLLDHSFGVAAGAEFGNYVPETQTERDGFYLFMAQRMTQMHAQIEELTKLNEESLDVLEQKLNQAQQALLAGGYLYDFDTEVWVPGDHPKAESLRKQIKKTLED